MTTISLSKRDGAAAHDASDQLLSPAGWVQVGLLGLLFVILFRDIIWRLAGFAWEDGDWSHAFIVPLIGIYFIYQHRDRLARMEARPAWFGLFVMLAGIVGYFLGIHPISNDMVKGYSMILALGGLVLLMTGWRMMSLLWFPVAYLVFAVKVSDRLWDYMAFKLQMIAAQCAWVLLNIVGVVMDLEADVTGNNITLIYQGSMIDPPLTVAEACSGLRSLMMFIALGVAVAFLTPRPWWARLTLVVLTIPVAVAANVLRVTTLGLIYPFKPELTRGDAHTFIGLVLLLIVALGLFMGIGWLLDQFSEPSGEQDGARPTAESRESST
jgi:exosortase